MPNLVYYTVGCSPTYIELLEMSVKSLRKSGYAGDIAVLCDESFLPKCQSLLGSDVLYKTFVDSKTPEQASMNKLRVFEFPGIDTYDKVLFLDCDILVHMDVQTLFDRVTRTGILYVYTETTKNEDHTNLMWGLRDYTPSELQRFKSHGVHVFNAGCFAFVRSTVMRDHFMAIQYMVTQHQGAFFYEQSFMNAYFNRNEQTDRTLLTDENYIFPPKDTLAHPGCLLHFAGDPGVGWKKAYRMREYAASHF